MKSCDEMIHSLYERRARQELQKKQKRRKLLRLTSVIGCVCLTVILGVGITIRLWPQTEGPKEKEILSMEGCWPYVDEQEWLQTSDIIFKGRVLEKKEPYFTNPNEDILCADGSRAINAYVTEYIVAVDELYKGEWTQETISVKAYNRMHLTVEQALYGEDENYIVQNSIPDIEMQFGECILGICYFDASLSLADEPCYELTFGMAGYFLEQEDGTYINNPSWSNQFSIDPNTLPEKIAALKK